MEELDEGLIANEHHKTYTLTFFISRIWTRPIKVFRALSSSSVFWQLLLVNLVIGLLIGSNRTISLRYILAGDYHLFNGYITLKYAAIYLGIVYFMITMIRWTGTWLGGEATWHMQSQAYILSNMPLLISIFTIALIFSFYSTSHHSLFSNTAEALIIGPFSYLLKYFKAAINLWCIVLHVISISVLQKFSYLKAIANLLLAAFFTAVPLLLLSYLGAF